MYATSSGRAPSPWLRRFGSPSPARRDLVCFPHAGGTASAFRDWAGLLSPSAGLLGVQYPGRQDRLDEPLATDIATLADDVATELARHADGPPLALFGHSMGAVVAFEVARRLGPGAVGHVFVSAARPPAEPRVFSDHLDDDASMVAYLRKLGGAGVDLYDDPDLRSLILPAVRGDLAMLARYRYRPGPPLRCPITAIVGETDPTCTAALAEGWSTYTATGFASHTMAGGHFYLETEPRSVVALVLERI